MPTTLIEGNPAFEIANTAYCGGKRSCLFSNPFSRLIAASQNPERYDNDIRNVQDGFYKRDVKKKRFTLRREVFASVHEKLSLLQS